MSKVMEEMLDFLGATPALLHGQGPDGAPVSEKKRKHKLTEQKGRQKINDQINDLKNLLPECRYVNTTKASVLECGVNALKRLQTLGNQLMIANKKLQRENKRLRTELEKYDPNAANWECNDNELETPDEVIPNLALQNPLGSLNDILPVDPVSSSPIMMDPYLSPVDFTSMPSSSPPTSSPPIPSFYVPSAIDSSSDFSSPYSDDYSMNPLNYKISKRRLLLVVLLVIPFFLSFDSIIQAPAGSEAAPGAPRKLLFFNTAAPVQILSAIYYLDVARLAMYVVLGFMGLHWTANTLLWFKQMQPEFSKSKGTC